MKSGKYILILFLFAATSFGYGQLDSSIMKLLSITDKTTFSEVFPELQRFKNSFPKERTADSLYFRGSPEHFRYYGFGICAYEIGCEKIKSVSTYSFDSERYKITILFDKTDSTIVYHKFEQLYGSSYKPNRIQLGLWYDSVRMETYFTQHDTIFQTNTIRNFESPPFLKDNYYGPLCPNHGSDQYDRMLEAVKYKHKDIILDWVKSFNLEDKTYGATGLYFLKRDGEELTESELALLELLQGMMVKVRTDLGSNYMRSLLNESSLERKYQRYKE